MTTPKWGTSGDATESRRRDRAMRPSRADEAGQYGQVAQAGTGDGASSRRRGKSVRPSRAGGDRRWGQLAQTRQGSTAKSRRRGQAMGPARADEAGQYGQVAQTGTKRNEETQGIPIAKTRPSRAGGDQAQRRDAGYSGREDAAKSRRRGPSATKRRRIFRSRRRGQVAQAGTNRNEETQDIPVAKTQAGTKRNEETQGIPVAKTRPSRAGGDQAQRRDAGYPGREDAAKSRRRGPSATKRRRIFRSRRHGQVAQAGTKRNEETQDIPVAKTRPSRAGGDQAQCCQVNCKYTVNLRGSGIFRSDSCEYS
ncbi:hypothetical protein [Cohnella sp. 56]|uniref:hypothetical protein n=1 Tax=Cohnella sp. 56 TaxID=3113722 RepID=UPI0030E96668